MGLRLTDIRMENRDPIRIVETIAARQRWECTRQGDDQVLLIIPGQWHNYAVTLASLASDDTLRLICSYELNPPRHRLPNLYEALNTVNDTCWAGAFNWWAENNLMIYRYALILSGGQEACFEQINTMITAAVEACERYYPALQLVTWGEQDLQQSMQVAIAEAHGHA